MAKHGRSKGRPVQHVEEEEKVGDDDHRWPRHETFTVQHLSHRGSVSEGEAVCGREGWGGGGG